MNERTKLLQERYTEYFRFFSFCRLFHSRSKFYLADRACFTLHKIEHRVHILSLLWLQGQLRGLYMMFQGIADFTSSCSFRALSFKRMSWKARSVSDAHK
jgi:hypothetical protein